MARNHAREERLALCDLLTDLGPDQPTLCAGWTTRDLAAHLVARERRPLAAPGLVWQPLSGYTDWVRRSLARRPFPALVETLRRPPRWAPTAVDRLDRAINTLEMFIHHEDVRRSQPGTAPRELPAALEAALWLRIRPFARLRLRRFPAPVIVHARGYDEVRTGRGEGEPVRVSGEPGELALFLTGRQAAARAALTGPEDLAGRLATARLGL
ncbi:MAG: TIGR03085 family protein [Micromonosporaceae bacterium]|nr:TIGR03085 family protein [Micromonosporaceae bacterium]